MTLNPALVVLFIVFAICLLVAASARKESK